MNDRAVLPAPELQLRLDSHAIPTRRPSIGPIDTAPLVFTAYQRQPDDFDWEALHQEAIRLAQEILPGLDHSLATAEGRRILRRRRLAGFRTSWENYWINSRRLREGDHSFRPIYFIWTMLNACNYRCAYCDDHMGRKYPDLPDQGKLDTDQGLNLLRVMRTGTQSIYFCGGEPTLRPDLPRMAREAARLNYFPILINSNGSRFHINLKKPEWHDFLTHLDIIIVSLDGVKPASLNALYVTTESDRVPLNILLLRELRRHIPFKLVVNSVITPDNIEEVSRVVDLCRDLGIWFVPCPANVGPEISDGLLNRPGYRALARKILDRKAEGQKIVGSPTLLGNLLSGKSVTCYTALKPHIDFNGDMLWPCKATLNVPPQRVNVLDYADVDEMYRAASQLVNPNRFHGPGADQCGANCNWMQNQTTDAYIRGLRAPFRSGFLREIREFMLSS